MPDLVSYRVEGAVATVRMDDGKVNALSRAMLAELGAALDRAEADGAVVVLTGRPGVFSAGFDLGLLRAGGDAALAMVLDGFELAARLLAFPAPVVVACPGHAIAMAVFLLLSGDYRLGTRGDYRITANEVAIGVTMPRAALELCRQRLTPAAFTRAALLAEVFTPEGAATAGFLDRVVEPGELDEAAAGTAAALGALDRGAHAASKRRARATTLAALRAAIDEDATDFRPAAG